MGHATLFQSGSGPTLSDSFKSPRVKKHVFRPPDIFAASAGRRYAFALPMEIALRRRLRAPHEIGPSDSLMARILRRLDSRYRNRSRKPAGSGEVDWIVRCV